MKRLPIATFLSALAALVALAAAPSGCKTSSNAPAPSSSASATSPSAAPTASSSSSGTVRPPDDLSDALAATAHTFELPAVAAMVFKNDRVLASGATGVRKQGESASASVDDVWELGSCVKAMTATLVAAAVDAGKLSFDDTLPKLFPDANVHPSLAVVTLDAVLQHHGGFDRDPPKALLDKAAASKDVAAARAALVRELLAKPAAHTPGTYSYSNAGYLVIAAALERALGKPYEAAMRERVFTPLGMSSCGFGSPTSPDRPNSSASAVAGHVLKEGHMVPARPEQEPRLAPVLAPTSAAYCTLGDWAKFLRVHLRIPQGTETIVSRASLARLHTPAFDKKTVAGFYLESAEWAGPGALRQFGTSGSYYSIAWLAPAKGLIYVMVTNAETASTPEAADKTLAPLFARYSK